MVLPWCYHPLDGGFLPTSFTPIILLDETLKLPTSNVSSITFPERFWKLLKVSILGWNRDEIPIFRKHLPFSPKAYTDLVNQGVENVLQYRLNVPSPNSRQHRPFIYKDRPYSGSLANNLPKQPFETMCNTPTITSQPQVRNLWTLCFICVSFIFDLGCMPHPFLMPDLPSVLVSSWISIAPFSIDLCQIHHSQLQTALSLYNIYIDLSHAPFWPFKRGSPFLLI